MGMLTSLKRQVSRKVVGTTSTGNAEIEEYAQKLENISSALEQSSKSIITTEQQWLKLYKSMKHQFENFVNVYPDNDDYRTVYKKGSDSCNAIGASYSNEDMSLPGRKIDFKVQEYLIEVNAILSETKSLADSYADYLDSVEKIAQLEKSKRADTEKIQRQEENSEILKQKYQAMCDDILVKMKRVYAKRKTMFNAAYVSYWRSQMTFVSMLEGEMKETSEYACKHEEQFLNLDVSKLG